MGLGLALRWLRDFFGWGLEGYHSGSTLEATLWWSLNINEYSGLAFG